MKRLLALLLLAVSLVACGSAAANTGTATTPQPTATTQAPTATPTTAAHFKVGQTVNVGGVWQITVTLVKTDGGNFAKPQHAGNTFLVVEINTKNISSTEQAINDANFTLRGLDGTPYMAGYDDNATDFLNGKVEASQPLKGSAVFEVPKAEHAFLLLFQVSFAEPGQTVWDIHV